MSELTKGNLLREDAFWYDGVNPTASRKSHAGGTIVGRRFGDTVDVLMAYGDGTDFSQTTIQNAINAIGSNNRTLSFAPGTWLITSNLTIASNFVIRVVAGAVFDVASGVTLTFSGPIIQDHATATQGSGTVTYNGTRTINGNVTIVKNLTVSGTITLGSVLITEILNRDVTQNEVVDTTTETTVYSFSVPADSLSTNRMLRMTLLGDYLNNSGTIRTVTFRVKYGATTMLTFDGAGGTLAASASRRSVRLMVELSAKNSNSAQIAHGNLHVGATVGDGADGAKSYDHVAVHNGVAEDSTGALTFAVTVEHSFAHASASIKVEAVQLELI